MPHRQIPLTQTALGAALLAVSAWISLPIGAVPFTLQTLVLFLLFALLGGKTCTQAVVVYLLLGTFGLPVFSGFQSGPGVLLGATGGFLIGFLAAALLMWGLERLIICKGDSLVIHLSLGLLACYTVGTLWFAAVYAGDGSAMSLGPILAICVLPYLPGDAVKLILVLLLARRLRPHIRVAGR